MLQQIVHSARGRLAMGIAGSLIFAAGVNTFLVPLDLYTGGLLGVAQLLRTLFYLWREAADGYDFSGLLYFLLNIPIFLLAARSLGRRFVRRALICTASCTLFLSLLPVPPAPAIEDTLAGCLVGGILSGLGSGIMLTCGCSSGGLDIVGLYLEKRGISITIGRFNGLFNALLFLLCGLLFSVPTMIYSIIYTAFGSIVLDKVHQQSITVQVLIFTKTRQKETAAYITDTLHRGVTCWNGKGAYTGEEIHVLCTCLNKYEIGELRDRIAAIDPRAFLTVQEGVKVAGNFQKRLL